MNQALYEAKLDQKKKCHQVLSQSHSRFNYVYEISGYEAFRLGQKQALLDPLQRSFFGPEHYDDLNRVDSNNYDLEFYATKKNLGVDFTEELDEETETQGEGSRASRSDHPRPSAKNQAEFNLPVALVTNPSELKGCLNILSSATSGGGLMTI